MLLGGAAAWYFVGKLPPTYKTSATIAAGIFEFQGVTLNEDNGFIQQYEINARFNQLIKDMTSRKNIRMLTNQLIAHDFRRENPFRLPDEELLGMSDSDSKLDDFTLVLQTNFQDTVLNFSPEFERHNRLLAEAYGYDYKSLMENLTVVREGDTDYVTVAYESESPQLSHYVVDTYCQEFLRMFQEEVTKDEDARVEFFEKLVDEKKTKLDSIIREINFYKSSRGLIDVETQSESAISSMQNYEDKREKEYQKIDPLKATIQVLGKKIQQYNRSFSAAYAKDLYNREDFVEIDKQIKELKSQLRNIRTGRKSIEQKISKLENTKTEIIALTAQIENS